MKKDKVVVGILGVRQDSGKGPKRWNKWRPSVSVAMQPSFDLSKYFLLYDSKDVILAERVLGDIQEKSPNTEVSSYELKFSDPWDFEQVYGELLKFSKNLKLELGHEELLIHMTTGTHVQQICLFLLADKGYLPGNLLQSIPLAGKESDSVGQSMTVDLNLENYKSLRSGLQLEQLDNVSFLKSGIDTKNESFNQTIVQLEKVALRSREPILLTGPTGSGKSKLASQIYELKNQKKQVSGKFVDVNCGTLQGNTTMSTLFGHKKGAFTGATTERKGMLAEADGGLLFLDEIGELGLDEQAMLLTAIETKTFRPMGSDQSVKSDFLLMAGTNKDLNELVEKGQFREDLLARINLWSFELPALKDRLEDIEPNLNFELQLAAKRLSHQVSISGAARKLYLEKAKGVNAQWRHNFRDLNSSVLRMATMAEAGIIEIKDVEDEWQRLELSWGGKAKGVALVDDKELISQLNLAKKLDPFDQITLEGTIRFIEPFKSMAEAGRHLFAESRKQKAKPNDADRLKKFLAKHQVSWAQIKGLEPGGK